MLHPRLPELVLADLGAPLNEEQAAAARALALDGRGGSVLQALAGTGKTRLLGAVARFYEAGGYRVLGVAPTGRAARELGDAAGIAAFTIHRLLSELEHSGGLAPRTVMLFDEAGTAPTRASAELFAGAEQAGAKVIAAGDSGQLPSVAAGGWFAAISDRQGGPQLRQVVRQRERVEREALAAVHDGEPEPYLQLKRDQGLLEVHEREEAALVGILADWNKARHEHGLSQAVMIARDNASRTVLNARARELLLEDGCLRPDAVVIADQEFRVGDRVIARRNDRYRDIDNGTLACIADIDRRTGALTLITDTGDERPLDATYAAEHLEHAYALTGHGAHGATVEWAGVIGRPWGSSRASGPTPRSHGRAGARASMWSPRRQPRSATASSTRHPNPSAPPAKRCRY